MVFSSTIFLFIFLPATLLGYYLIERRFKNVFLLIASLLFYAWGEPKFLPVLLLSTLVNYSLALWVQKARNSNGRSSAKLALMFAVIFNIALLFIFKYVNFSVKYINVAAAFFTHKPGFEVFAPTNIILPIGISFFTFHGMSYVFDVYRGNADALKNPLNVGLYITFFPQLIAGPIVRFKTISQQLLARQESLSDFSNGIKRFIIGLAKKVLIANTVAAAADYAFDKAGNGLTVGLAWFGAICYTIQIYYDFSGYSDMAIGLAKMFGFHFLENFNYPYASSSVTDFWRRWHISLSSWFRDYIYIPLGGSRVKKTRLVFNLFVVWVLTGVWHGANWTFISWGFFYFILLTFEKLTGIAEKIKTRPLATIAYRIFTVLCIICGWVLFRSNNITSAVAFLRSMFGAAPKGMWSQMTGNMISQYAVVLVIAIIFCFDWKKTLSRSYEKLQTSVPTVMFIVKIGLIATLAIISVSFTVASTYNPFIYFNF